MEGLKNRRKDYLNTLFKEDTEDEAARAAAHAGDGDVDGASGAADNADAGDNAARRHPPGSKLAAFFAAAEALYGPRPKGRPPKVGGDGDAAGGVGGDLIES